ncbi:hypothetical protein CH378_18035 [Leptospira kmetyi]|uniref:Uncharacterized protein n=1 Tax=Leptospira kmetyi TaxID=408139 RepID=A0ABX4N4Q1_9LEPT|nr:hypothetical protein CH378_18035 [Leptospira kmetyi]
MHNFISSLRSLLHGSAHLLCRFGSRDVTKVARTSCEPNRIQALGAATSRRPFVMRNIGDYV